jgi:hypothetical protein
VAGPANPANTATVDTTIRFFIVIAPETSRQAPSRELAEANKREADGTRNIMEFLYFFAVIAAGSLWRIPSG